MSTDFAAEFGCVCDGAGECFACWATASRQQAEGAAPAGLALTEVEVDEIGRQAFERQEGRCPEWEGVQPWVDRAIRDAFAAGSTWPRAAPPLSADVRDAPTLADQWLKTPIRVAGEDVPLWQVLSGDPKEAARTGFIAGCRAALVDPTEAKANAPQAPAGGEGGL